MNDERGVNEWMRGEMNEREVDEREVDERGWMRGR